MNFQVEHWGGVLLLTSIAAITDFRTGKIPNWLTLPGALAGLGYSVVAHGTQGLWLSVLGLLICFLVPAIVYWSSKGRAIGGGDLKLFALLGAWLGPSAGLELQLTAFVFVMVLAFVQLTWRGKLLGVLKNSLWLTVNSLRKQEERRALAPELLTELRMGPCIWLATLGYALLELQSSGVV